MAYANDEPLEGRILCARKTYDHVTAEKKWGIIAPQKEGIPIAVTKSSSTIHNAMVNLNHGPLVFLTDLTGKGGAWHGWKLHAVGALRMVGGDEMFDFVLAREKDKRSLKEGTLYDFGGGGWDIVAPAKK
ncbi:MAG: hypothetical protein Q9217_001147 [Psora testacea]